MPFQFQQVQTAVVTSQTTSTWLLVDPTINPFNVTVSVVLTSSPNLTYQVEYTAEANPGSATALVLPDMVGMTASDTRLIIASITAVRLNVTSYTAGTATLIVRQSGVPNRAAGQ